VAAVPAIRRRIGRVSGGAGPVGDEGCLNSQPTADRIGDLALAVYKTVVGHGVLPPARRPLSASS
jgi:hypothetical protein